MLSYFDLRKGIKFVLDGEPYEVLEFQQIGKAQDVFVAKTKIRNLISGKVFDRNFHKDDTFEEAELDKVEAKFIYGRPIRPRPFAQKSGANGASRKKFVFCELVNPKNRFELTEEQIGSVSKFLKPNQILTGVKFQREIINIALPIKIDLKVVEAPPGLKGDRAQAGNKPVVLETGATINAPLFVEEGDIIEVNTETGEYVRRVKE